MFTADRINRYILKVQQRLDAHAPCSSTDDEERARIYVSQGRHVQIQVTYLFSSTVQTGCWLHAFPILLAGFFLLINDSSTYASLCSQLQPRQLCTSTIIAHVRGSRARIYGQQFFSRLMSNNLWMQGCNLSYQYLLRTLINSLSNN